jgi:hypothetical protein
MSTLQHFMLALAVREIQFIIFAGNNTSTKMFPLSGNFAGEVRTKNGDNLKRSSVRNYVLGVAT